jgi:hypothetical protein
MQRYVIAPFNRWGGISADLPFVSHIAQETGFLDSKAITARDSSA